MGTIGGAHQFKCHSCFHCATPQTSDPKGPAKNPKGPTGTQQGVKSQNVCKSGRAYAATNRVRIFLPCALRRAMYSSNCLTCSLVNFTLHQRALHRSSVA
jgi:hypothetical protein